jgi:superfamily II DNA or RNA helicase
MVNTARDKWYSSDECTIKSLVEYIIQTGQIRDAQVEAIKTYLFLKVSCGNKPLSALFSGGAFNSIDLDKAELSKSSREYMDSNPAAAALLEYAMLKNDAGVQVSEKLEKAIKKEPESVDYKRFWREVFYGVTYTDYLFSLPMGAGKTYLMAAFIYLDLYFAMNEPLNPAFAHNFIIFAPSGLKSSVIPSLRTIQKFNPTWIIPEPSASDIKRKMIFEVMIQGKTANKSNKTKNPNVQKIANHQPLSELFGLVAVTNAEKVILDRIQEKDGQISFSEESDDDKDRTANELRNLIGKLPSLSIFIDEVHHAVSDEIKLRAVVNKWMADNKTINSVIGFSGTPYLEKAEKREVVNGLQIASAEISNIVYYYPLINGVGNFLKRPVVKISDVADSETIIEKGVREFLDTYKNTIYDGGFVAKLGIYCGTIEKLEEIVFPLVSRITVEYGLSPDAILKFHKGNKTYPMPPDSQLQFDSLDLPFSKIRIVLLVQIGKEGWDCRSLTGIILSQEGDCPKNMVLQTSCRCLRQVVRDMTETALIYLNESNAEKLNTQLKQQHHISLKEFQSGGESKYNISRYNRRAFLKLPPIQFYQLNVQYENLTLEKAEPVAKIPAATENSQTAYTVKTQDFSQTVTNIAVDDSEHGTSQATFYLWLYNIAKASFGFITVKQLKTQTVILQNVFATITFERDGVRYFSSKYNHALIEANIRKAFYEKRGFTTKEELILQEAELLNTENFTTSVNTDSPEKFFPAREVVENIIAEDNGELNIPQEIYNAVSALKVAGLHDNAEEILKPYKSHTAKDRSFHYLPYKIDSLFERTFLEEVLVLEDISRLGLEVYYNGDRSLTEFKINCYKQNGGKWQYIGMYTPDFIIIRRKAEQIHQAVIVETKGKIYANDPTFKDKRGFMEVFKNRNNEQFGYNRFEYLYLEDTLPDVERIKQTHKAITAFFKEETENA